MQPGLHYNWHRHYDASIGRYTQPDPLGFVDGPSVYGYVTGSPNQAADSTGLEVSICCRAAQIGGRVGAMLDHCWVKTDKLQVGLGGNPNAEEADSYTLGEFYGVDHSKDKPRTCRTQKNVDEDCVNRELEKALGTAQGRISLSNNCQTWAKKIVDKCAVK